jgi:hypothetical protein
MSGPRLLSESIPRIAGQVFSRKYMLLGRLVTRWTEIVGADMAEKAQPVKIRTTRSKGKNGKDNIAISSLDIAVSPADATVLHYRKDLILERINQIFGEQLIAAIRFVPQAANGPAPALRKRPKLLTEADKSALSALIAPIGDTEIASRLQSLGAAILQDR